ncbi:MAG: hypothetical protein ACK4IX_10325, partial [Candidatus Sericytochromatia bacterium]
VYLDKIDLILNIDKYYQSCLDAYNKKDYFEAMIDSSVEYDSPESMIQFLTFYLLWRAKLPTGISKNEILEHLNQDKLIFTPIEVDLICRSLNLRYSKEFGFVLKVNS